MMMSQKWHRGRLLRIFRCHGDAWEVLLSPLFPQRNFWSPICEECGAHFRFGPDGWEMHKAGSR